MPAFAQEAGAPQPQAADANNGLEDIIVTATRRAERSQSIPVAITAIGGDQLKAAAATNLQALTKAVVGVQFDADGGQKSELAIRGIFTNRFDIGSNPSSGVYVDDVYQPRFADVFSGLVDVSRVEVLRGPQGTLFGRNTIGGAVSIFTTDPGDSFEGYVSGGYGNRSLVDVRGAITTPISDTVSNRFAAGYRDRKGFMHDLTSGKSDGFSHLTVRDTFVAKLTDSLTFKLNGSYYRGNYDATLYDPIAGPLVLQGPQTSYTLDKDPWHGTYSYPGFNKVRNKQASGRLVWDADPMTITGIVSWVGYGLDIQQDYDGTDKDLFGYGAKARSDTYSGELRFSSNSDGFLSFGDRLKWVAGLYLFQDKGYENSDLYYGTGTTLALAEFNNPARVAGTPLQGAHKLVYLNSNLTSVALYGQGTFAITDKIGLTFGGRYTRDERKFTLRGDQASVPTFARLAVPYTFVAKPVDTSFDPKIGLEFKPNAGTLLYATFSQGFKGGGTQSTPGILSEAQVILRPEKVKAYEVGMKADFLDQHLRLNWAVFYNKYRDLQVRRSITLPNGVSISPSDNAATATTKGVELEVSARLTQQLRIDTSYAYLRGRFGEYRPSATTNYGGFDLPRAPSHRLNGSVNYDMPLGGADLSLRASYNYTSSFYFRADNLASQKQKAYGLADASATLKLHGGTSVQLWGRNLFDKKYASYLNSIASEVVATYGDRRTYGFTVTQNF
ncbi:TonB-dependent receptor [Sphingomonas sp. Root710]|uniref:TonB-dependent receptor n=1 Tax=Sphingomonas sp. Root710 TaxID=1736594 RepID=UPI00138F6587|nr:TonB-dependent receptor [Sphingomonas sp. Root710]